MNTNYTVSKETPNTIEREEIGWKEKQKTCSQCKRENEERRICWKCWVPICLECHDEIRIQFKHIYTWYSPLCACCAIKVIVIEANKRYPTLFIEKMKEFIDKYEEDLKNNKTVNLR